MLGARNELIQREKERESLVLETEGEVKSGDWLSGHTLVLSSALSMAKIVLSCRADLDFFVALLPLYGDVVQALRKKHHPPVARSRRAPALTVTIP